MISMKLQVRFSNRFENNTLTLALSRVVSHSDLFSQTRLIVIYAYERDCSNQQN